MSLSVALPNYHIYLFQSCLMNPRRAARTPPYYCGTKCVSVFFLPAIGRQRNQQINPDAGRFFFSPPCSKSFRDEEPSGVVGLAVKHMALHETINPPYHRPERAAIFPKSDSLPHPAYRWTSPRTGPEKSQPTYGNVI